MGNQEFEKSKTFVLLNTIDYIPHTVVIKTIIRKITGHVSAISFDSGEVLTTKYFPFDTLIQIIEGKAEVIIDDNSTILETGEIIIMPAHCRNVIKANTKFKMLSTIIKSGYEEII